MSAPFTPGLPPDGADGAFIGQDRRGGHWLLRWNPLGHWEALGWEPTFGAPIPTLTQLSGEQQGLIVGYVEIAERSHPDRPTLSRCQQLDNASLGTKAPAVMGGWWCKVERGWKWNGPNGNGGTFPRPGGDWTSDLIAPEPLQRLRQRLEQRMQSAVVDAERMNVAIKELLAEATLGVRYADLAALLAAQALHGPFGHLVGPVDLDETFWRIDDDPYREPGYFSLPMFTQVDPFTLMHKREGGQ